MRLPADFVFSQDSLQDLVDCRRRFQLKHVVRLAWPAVEAEPVLEHELHMQMGAAFHRLVHQHVSGLPADRLATSIGDEELRLWWTNYLEHQPAGLPETRNSELVLTAPLGGRRLVARYDLVASEAGGRMVIVDWKTSRRKPKRGTLAERLQTRVYPYLLVRAGAHLNGGEALLPEQVVMVYWYSEFPDEPEVFEYDGAQFESDGAYLAGLAVEVDQLPEGDQPLTDNRNQCRYCVYRSLCERGVGAGPLDRAEDDEAADDVLGLSFEFGEVEEIVY